MTQKSIDKSRSVREIIRAVKQRLDKARVYCGHGTDNTLDEAAWLVGGALKWTPAELDARIDTTIDDAGRAAIDALVEQRVRTRKPTAYLLNEAWFAGRRFYVDERVIVPRSLTGEFILERFTPWIEGSRVRRLLDLCTGSGCMAIACAYAFPEARIDAADLSSDALAVARRNVEMHNLSQRLRLVQSDLYQALKGERYDVILTNPPYVARTEMKTLPKEYGFEPEMALVSGDNGLDAVLRILQEAPEHLEPGGILIAEVGNSHEVLQRILPQVSFTWLATSTGDESVFLLTADQLARHTRDFARAAGL